MKSFHFRLERVLDWRRMEMEQAEMAFKQQSAALAELDRQRAETDAADLRAQLEVRAWRPVWGGDLAALGAFRAESQKRQQKMQVRRAECEKQLAARWQAMMEARRRLRLLERLKERRLSEWRAACDSELEQQAAEAYMAKISRQLTVASYQSPVSSPNPARSRGTR
jgi:DNA repair exonuclease SbcCD ATPase subunit